MKITWKYLSPLVEGERIASKDIQSLDRYLRGAMKINLSLGAAVISLALGLPAEASTLGRQTVFDWNNAALNAIVNTSPGPTVAARALSLLHTGIFDAWAAYDPVAIGTQLPNLQRPDSENTFENKNEAISFAAYSTLVDLFPNQVSLFDNVLANLGYNPTNPTSTAAGIGNQAAKALLDFRHNDGSNQLGNLSASGIPYSDYTGYTPVNLPDTITNTNPATIIDPNRWQPLVLPDGTVQEYLTPHWNRVTPFGLASGDQLRPTQGPKRYPEDTEGYIEQAEQLIKISANLTDEQKAIAEYWAGGSGTVTPPGYWNQFAQEVSNRDNQNLDDAVKMFFSLNNAIFDASIVAWDAKIAFDSERPNTGIHFLANQKLFPNDGVSFRINPATGVQEVFAWAGPNQGNQWIPGKEWVPYLVVTNPFPDFVSGHSTMSPAAAEVLKRFTGSDRFGFSHTTPAGSSVIEPGGFATDILLNWDTFTDAANQAGISRLYGGIHWEDAEVVGQRLGRESAEYSWNKAQFYIQGGKSVPEPTSTFSLLAFAALGAGSVLKRNKKTGSVEGE